MSEERLRRAVDRLTDAHREALHTIRQAIGASGEDPEATEQILDSPAPLAESERLEAALVDVQDILEGALEDARDILEEGA